MTTENFSSARRVLRVLRAMRGATHTGVSNTKSAKSADVCALGSAGDNSAKSADVCAFGFGGVS